MKRKLISPLNTLTDEIVIVSLSWRCYRRDSRVWRVDIPLSWSDIWLWRLNPAAMLLVNQLAYPLQFALYLPFIRAGEWLFAAEPLPFSITEIFELFRSDLLTAIDTL